MIPFCKSCRPVVCKESIIVVAGDLVCKSKCGKDISVCNYIVDTSGGCRVTVISVGNCKNTVSINVYGNLVSLNACVSARCNLCLVVVDSVSRCYDSVKVCLKSCVCILCCVSSAELVKRCLVSHDVRMCKVVCICLCVVVNLSAGLLVGFGCGSRINGFEHEFLHNVNHCGKVVFSRCDRSVVICVIGSCVLINDYKTHIVVK